MAAHFSEWVALRAPQEWWGWKHKQKKETLHKRFLIKEHKEHGREMYSD